MPFFQRTTLRALATGLLCGAVGGAVGSLAKLGGEALYPPRTQGQTPPPVILARKLAGHPLTQAEEQHRSQVVHWTFSIGTGAVYGAAAEFAPIVTVGVGVPFGVVLLGLTHETLVPAAGLDKPAPQQPAREHLSELFTHILYAVATELVRRLLRRRFGPQPAPSLAS